MMKRVVKEYNEKFRALADSGRYDGRDDFTVVYQPYMEDAPLPIKADGKPDMTFVAPDCFHFSSRGHESIALAMWNNMLEPVGKKTKAALVTSDMYCPTKEHPYIFTKQNSITPDQGEL
ncbi:PREDICTED: phospholipase B1, membrane-associated-like [Priapulus caudatus]|uniref:Phospholipase B1, membrane-associated-like n=1 Tax=Priapulus caudatus TaxID=37621 RepID=A0ABM1DR59_PRICU|nr:PREDICTED: phospholipase B1, membrane-associated-like [Priapulus caudatus]